jgi:hypothetical protein
MAISAGPGAGIVMHSFRTLVAVCVMRRVFAPAFTNSSRATVLI